MEIFHPSRDPKRLTVVALNKYAREFLGDRIGESFSTIRIFGLPGSGTLVLALRTEQQPTDPFYFPFIKLLKLEEN